MNGMQNANSLEEFWLPFTGNRAFKKDPRMLTRAEGMYFWDHQGERIEDDPDRSPFQRAVDLRARRGMLEAETGAQRHIGCGRYRSAQDGGEIMTHMTSSEAFVEQLVAEGVTEVFGIVGSAYMDALDIFEPAGIRFVSVAHEQNAAHMADGYSRVTQASLPMWLTKILTTYRPIRSTRPPGY